VNCEPALAVTVASVETSFMCQENQIVKHRGGVAIVEITVWKVLRGLQRIIPNSNHCEVGCILTSATFRIMCE